MASPFPGMDPYLEGELWQEFHDTLINSMRAQLMPRLAPKYVALLAKRYVLDSPMPEEVPVLSLEIRDVAERRLVTVLEILSPVNKRGDGAREYVTRRTELLQTHTHLLEIDLLRRGGRIPLAGHLPQAPYYVFLSRFTQRPQTEVWAIGLRERLPTVPVPLLPPDKDIPLDLQSAIDACFALVGYERLLNYHEDPPPPPFSAADAAWIAARLAEAQG